MANSTKKMYIIAGCNGSGKTTASYSILPEILNCKEFINADEIARGLSPFQVETVAIEASRIMIHRIDEMMKSNKDFAVETTLASRTYKNKIINAQKNGFDVILIFYFLNSIELAYKRVENRVKEGGHNIEKDVIKRRFISGIKNLFEIYIPIVDEFFIYDNTNKLPDLIAFKSSYNVSGINILNNNKFQLLKGFHYA